jgi:hypothetical protein
MEYLEGWYAPFVAHFWETVKKRWFLTFSEFCTARNSNTGNHVLVMILAEFPSSPSSFNAVLFYDS